MSRAVTPLPAWAAGDAAQARPGTAPAAAPPHSGAASIPKGMWAVEDGPDVEVLAYRPLFEEGQKRAGSASHRRHTTNLTKTPPPHGPHPESALQRTAALARPRSTASGRRSTSGAQGSLRSGVGSAGPRGLSRTLPTGRPTSTPPKRSRSPSPTAQPRPHTVAGPGPPAPDSTTAFHFAPVHGGSSGSPVAAAAQGVLRLLLAPPMAGGGQAASGGWTGGVIMMPPTPLPPHSVGQRTWVGGGTLPAATVVDGASRPRPRGGLRAATAKSPVTLVDPEALQAALVVPAAAGPHTPPSPHTRSPQQHQRRLQRPPGGPGAPMPLPLPADAAAAEVVGEAAASAPQHRSVSPGAAPPSAPRSPTAAAAASGGVLGGLLPPTHTPPSALIGFLEPDALDPAGAFASPSPRLSPQGATWQ
jgi:hypothetical protein